jgi:FMN phosphatase YigB (HAD superfamily)
LRSRSRPTSSWFCGDAGWRKPAKPIFELALQKLQTQAGDCLFVGDDPRWDVAGPRAMGMDAVLVDRLGETRDDPSASIGSLRDLWRRLR